MYAGCLVYWQSKLQTEIALSTTEAEVLSLSQALRATIPLMEITREMKRSGHCLQAVTPTRSLPPFRRLQRRHRTSHQGQGSPKNQVHGHQMASLSSLRREWINQDPPYRYQRSACRHAQQAIAPRSI